MVLTIAAKKATKNGTNIANTPNILDNWSNSLSRNAAEGIDEIMSNRRAQKQPTIKPNTRLIRKEILIVAQSEIRFSSSFISTP